MKRRKCLVGICVLLTAFVLVLLAACGGPGNCETALNSRRTYRIRICTDKKKYDFGEPIHITFTVTNVSDEPLVFDGGDEPTLDIRVRGEHWSDGQELTPQLIRVALEPGESHTIEWVWPTSNTDLEELKLDTNPGGRDVDIDVIGGVIAWPGASEGSALVDAIYIKR